MTKEIIFSVIGGIIGFASSFFMWKIQVRYEQKNIAKAFILEISSLEESLKIFVGMFNNPPPDPNIKYISIDQPFYKNGLFLASGKKYAFLTESCQRAFLHFIRIY